MKTLLLLTLTLLLGCNNYSKHIEEQVENNVEITIKEISAKVQKAKEDFTICYQAVEKSNINNLNKPKLKEFNSSIIDTGNYLDSLKQEMATMDEMDVNNVKLVKATFLYKGAGDSIINKFKRSLAAAQNAAKTEQQKLDIRLASDSLFTEPSSEKWKEQMFGLTSPLGVKMIICGLQTELYNIGMKALGDK